MYMTFICKSSGKTITVETETQILSTVLNDFSEFLKGAGFIFDGELGFVLNENLNYPLWDNPTKSKEPYYEAS